MSTPNSKEQKAINAVNNLKVSIYNERGTELRFNHKSKLWEVLDQLKKVHCISNDKYPEEQLLLFGNN